MELYQEVDVEVDGWCVSTFCAAWIFNCGLVFSFSHSASTLQGHMLWAQFGSGGGGKGWNERMGRMGSDGT